MVYQLKNKKAAFRLPFHLFFIRKLSSCAIEIRIIHLHDVLKKRHGEHQIRRDPRRRVSEAQCVVCRNRRRRRDCSAGECRRQKQANRHAGDQLRRACSEDELRAADSLHAVPHNKNEAQKHVQRQVNI